jgi:hypothetical protein
MQDNMRDGTTDSTNDEKKIAEYPIGIHPIQRRYLWNLAYRPCMQVVSKEGIVQRPTSFALLCR